MIIQAIETCNACIESNITNTPLDAHRCEGSDCGCFCQPQQPRLIEWKDPRTKKYNHSYSRV